MTLIKLPMVLKTGELIIIAGRPSMGKTSFAINITQHLIFNLKIRVHIFSLEMSKNEILDKLIAISTNIALQQIQNKVINKKDWPNIQTICKNFN